MKGYRDQDGFHIVLEGNLEGTQLVIMVCDGWRVWKDLVDMNPKDKVMQAAFKEANSFREKISEIFIADNYREGGATKENPVVARDEYSKR